LIEQSKDINEQSEALPTFRLLKESTHLSLQKSTTPLGYFCEALISACKSESIASFDLASLFEQLQFTASESFALACAIQPEVKQEISQQGMHKNDSLGWESSLRQVANYALLFQLYISSK
jgi:hypothetical protein